MPKIKIILSGCNGHMGQVLTSICAADPETELTAGFDISGQNDGRYPVFPDPVSCNLDADAVIDFSHPSALDPLLRFCTTRHIPVVLAVTGYSREQLEQIDSASQTIPVFRSANLSLGINALAELVKKAVSLLGTDYDVEIVERHHHRKLDAPSGTSLMLADAASSALPYEPGYVFGRHGVRRARDPHEIGISSVRGGSIVGDHTVILAGRDEVIELSHHAASREIFATGAVRAAKFLAAVKKPGLYDMSSMMDSSWI